MGKILIIEDEFLLRTGVSDILSYEGFEVLQAENGAIGIETAIEQIPELILCDIMMPVMDGYEVLKSIRKNEQTKLIPFIFMTALSERNDLRAGMILGSDDYLTKPFSRDELLSAVQTRLKKAGEIRERSEASLNELRTNIISHLPHELRTPLNGITGCGQLLMEFPETLSLKDIAEMGRNIHESAVRLYHLIENYLVYAHLVLRKDVPPTRGEVDEPEKAIESKAMEVAKSHNRLADLTCNLSGGVVMMGWEELSKIVEELTDNAFKFSEAGSPVRVECYLEGANFCLNIHDQGRGMEVTDIDKIGAYMQFDRLFYEQQGSGLGLIIAIKFVELFSGKLLVQSVPGKGTTIRITLPGKIISEE